ncbi:MAG: hypothetical protein R2843_05335 [Thermomicrobiales bacterium]
MVSEDDMAAAVDALDAQIAPALGEVLSESAGTTIVVLPASTATHAELVPESNVATGSEATEFTVTASTYATGLTFSLESAREAILNAATASVTVPEARRSLTDAEITFSPCHDASTNDAIAAVLIWRGVADLDDDAVDALRTSSPVARSTKRSRRRRQSTGSSRSRSRSKPDSVPVGVTDRMPLVSQRIEIRES